MKTEIYSESPGLLLSQLARVISLSAGGDTKYMFDKTIKEYKLLNKNKQIFLNYF